MRDLIIADVDTPGTYEGVYGEMGSLGLDMFADVNLGDLPVAEPRPSVPTTETVVTKAVVQKIQQLPKAVQKRVLTQPSYAVVKRPAYAEPKMQQKLVESKPKRAFPVTRKGAVGLLALGVAAVVLVSLSSKK